MLKDYFIDTSSDDTKEDIQNAITDAKTFYSENVPYKLYPSTTSRDDKIVVFKQHFIDTFRMVLSNPDDGCILQMSEAERDVYYSYLEYKDGLTVTDKESPLLDPEDPLYDATKVYIGAEMLIVVEELDNCLVNEIACKTSSYLDQCFSIEHTWDENPLIVESTNTVRKLTQEQYDQLVADSEMIDSTMYIITLDSVEIKIYVGNIVIWESA